MCVCVCVCVCVCMYVYMYWCGLISSAVVTFFCDLKSSFVPLRQTLFWKQPEVIQRHIWRIGRRSFSVIDFWSSQKPLDRERLSS